MTYTWSTTCCRFSQTNGVLGSLRLRYGWQWLIVTVSHHIIRHVQLSCSRNSNIHNLIFANITPTQTNWKCQICQFYFELPIHALEYKKTKCFSQKMLAKANHVNHKCNFFPLCQQWSFQTKKLFKRTMTWLPLFSYDFLE